MTYEELRPNCCYRGLSTGTCWFYVYGKPCTIGNCPCFRKTDPISPERFTTDHPWRKPTTP